MVDEGVGVPAFDAELAATGRVGGARLDPDQPAAIVADEVEGAAGAAVGTGGEGFHSAPRRPLTSLSQKTGPSVQQ